MNSTTDYTVKEKFISDKNRLVCICCNQETDIMYSKNINNPHTFFDFFFQDGYKYVIGEGILCQLCSKF